MKITINFNNDYDLEDKIESIEEKYEIINIDFSTPLNENGEFTALVECKEKK